MENNLIKAVDDCTPICNKCKNLMDCCMCMYQNTNKEKKFPRKLTEKEKDRLAMELSEENHRDGETEDKEKKE